MITADEVLRGALPGWMLKTSRAHWKKFMRAAFKVIDTTFDNMRLARLASMPGQIDATNYGGFESVEALPLIGRDRRLARGKLEPAHEYAARLRYWREAWRLAGTHAGLLNALRGVLSPSPPTVRLVQGGSPTSNDGYHWWTLDDTGLRFQQTGPDGEHNGLFWPADGGPAEADNSEAVAWDWDSEYWTLHAVNPDPSRTWVIVYAPCNLPELAGIEGQFNDGVSVFGEAEAGTGDKYTIGTTATLSYVETARAACAEFKSAGVVVPHIIIAFGDGLFVPVNPAPDPGDYPDGWWRHHGKITTDGGTPVVWRRERARNPGARYWLGTV